MVEQSIYVWSFPVTLYGFQPWSDIFKFENYKITEYHLVKILWQKHGDTKKKSF
jgi:hypothetical protein